MARNPLVDAITCESCGATFKASHDRCPRCRTRVAVTDPAAIEASSRRLKRAAIYVSLVALVGFAAVWLLAPAAASAVAVPGPRRPTVSAPKARPKTPVDRPFMDASGKAYEAYQAGDFNAALKNYQDAVARNPQDAEASSNLGQVLVRLGRTAEALPSFNKAIELNPDRWAYHFNRARAEGLLGHWTECIAGYRRAQQLFPNDYATAYNLALALHHSGDEESAVVEYQKAIDLAPEDGIFRRALAISFEALNRKSEAAAAYEEYLKLTPDASDADAVRQRIAQLRGAAPAAASAPDKTAESR